MNGGFQASLSPSAQTPWNMPSPPTAMGEVGSKGTCPARERVRCTPLPLLRARPGTPDLQLLKHVPILYRPVLAEQVPSRGQRK